MQHTAPRQTKFLGATVRGLGVIVAVSSTLTFCYAVVADADRVNHRVPLADLKRDEVVFLAEPQAYVTRNERVAYGVWDEVHALVPAPSDRAITALIAYPDRAAA